MKKIVTVVMAFIVMSAQIPLTMAVVAAPTNNLIINGSFEDQTNGLPSSWAKDKWGTNTTTFTYETTGQDGTKSATVKMTKYTSGDAKWAPKSVAVMPNTTYTFSDWYKSGVMSSIDAVYTTTAGKTVYKWLGDLSASASWKQAVYSFKTPKNVSKVTFFHSISAVGSLTTDNFSLVAGTIVTPTPTPTPNPVPTPTPAPTAPTVSISTPVANTTVSGSQTISATAADAVSVSSVQFKLDGTVLGVADTSAPYSIAWDTTTVADGTHNLTAVATNSSNLQTTSSTVAVVVKNAVVVPTPTPIPTPTPTPVPTPANLIANSSVETVSGTTPTAWHGDGWGTNTRQLTYEPTGYDGVKSVKTTISSYTSGDAKWYFDDVAITPGATYSYSNWYKSSVATEIDAMVTLADGTVQYYYLTTASASPSVWQKVSAQFTAPAGAAKVTVFQVLDKVGYVQSDSFSFASYQPAKFSRPLVSLTFDDGWRSIYTNGLPILQKYNFPSTQYLLTSTTDYPDYMTLSMMQAFKTQGSEIASHTVTHPHLPTLNAATLNSELADSQQFLRNQFGSDTAKNFASPYGEYNDSVINAIKTYYRSHRSTDVGYNSKDSFDIYNIKVQNITNAVTPAQVKAWVDQAVATNTWLVIVYHEVTTTAADSTYAVTPANLDAELSFVQQSGVTVKTVDQALDEIVPQL